MPDDSPAVLRTVPDQPDLRHLKDQAKELLRAGGASTLAEAQFKLARQYGFASWPKLKRHVDSLHEAGMLKRAIDRNDFAAVRALMKRNPELHRAPMGYGKNGPLTWVAECRIPWEAPGPVRLAMAQWMIDNGSDVHQGGDGPLMRAALVDQRIPMMELLVRNGADVNAEWNGRFPILFAPCETLARLALKWLLEHGADPHMPEGRGHESPLDYVIETYSRSPLQAQCIGLLMEAGCATRRDAPAAMELLRGRQDELGRMLDAEYCNVDAARMLVGRGADVNARAEMDGDGVGGQTPLFHAVSQFYDYGLALTKYLVASGANLSARARLPGRYERPEEIVECTALGFALRFPGTESATLRMLRESGAPE